MENKVVFKDGFLVNYPGMGSLDRVQPPYFDEGRFDGLRKLSGRRFTAAASRGIEAVGANLVAEAWLGCMGAAGKFWGRKLVLGLMVDSITTTMAKRCGAFGPRDFIVGVHDELFLMLPSKEGCDLWMFPDCDDCLGKDGHSALLVFKPFDPATLSLPPGVTHVRFFATLGALCDFLYCPVGGCYVPVRPDVVGLSDVRFSEILPCCEVVSQSVELEVCLPGAPVMDSSTRLFFGMGMEYLRWEVGKMPRVLWRVFGMW